ncbi:MAG: helix-turn-helix transcriptional regulator [Coriobacteriales bacterium]|nr:helix-turn-helix transcriptional regulator [Coriobacteriales bacterium]
MSSTHNTQAAESRTIVEYTPEQIRQSVGSQLHDARKKAQLTQMQLSAACGIDQAVISRVERGKANPTLSLLQALATPLNMRVALVPAREHQDDEADEE